MGKDMFPQNDEPEDDPKDPDKENPTDAIDVQLFLISKKDDRYSAEYYEQVVYSKKDNAFVLMQVFGTVNTVGIIRNLIQNHTPFRETLLTIINIFLYLGGLYQRKEHLNATSYIIDTLVDEKEGYELTHIVVYNSDEHGYRNIDIINDNEFQKIDIIDISYHEMCFCKSEGISLLRYLLADDDSPVIGDYISEIFANSFSLPSDLAKEELTQSFALN